MNDIGVDVFIDAVILVTQVQDEKSIDVVNQLIAMYTEEIKTNTTQDTQINRLFVQLLQQLKQIPAGAEHKLERMSLLAKFLTKDEIKQEEVFCASINNIFNSLNEVDATNVTALQRKLNNSIMYNQFVKHCKRMWNKLSVCATASDDDKVDMYLNDAINISREIVAMAAGEKRNTSGAVERIVFSNEESLETGRQKFNALEYKGILKTGLQGLNKMLGKRNGFVLGETVCIYALLHNFKSGLLMTIARGLACYNDPSFLPNPTNAKPLILFVSLENAANKNMDWLYKTAYEGMYARPAKGLNDGEIVQFTKDFYTKRGFEFIMERRVGRFFGIEEYQAMIEGYKAQGYMVVCCLLDYAEKMRKTKATEFSKNQSAFILGELFNELCTYNQTNDILFITANQLNRDAMRLAQEKNNVVKHFSAAVAAKSIDISQEIDLEIFIHLERNASGKKFLTAMRGKHRYVDDTPDVDKYFAYPFTEYGILDDINGPAQYVRDIYAVGDDTTDYNDKMSDVF